MEVNSMKKIMIVEDEYIIAMSYMFALKKYGFDVSRIIDTGEEAISAFVSLNPDIILMDIKLKGPLDGIETARQILELRKLPIIFMTGNSDIETKEKALELGSVEYMYKPIDMMKLVAKIKEITN